MTKRVGTIIGLLLVAVGLGIPATVGATDSAVPASELGAERGDEVTRAVTGNWDNNDHYAIGVDPFGGIVENSAPAAATTAYGSAEEQWNASNEVARGLARGSYDNVDQYAIGLDPFGGAVEGPERTIATTSFGSAEEQWNASLETAGTTFEGDFDTADLAAIGFDPYGGTVEVS